MDRNDILARLNAIMRDVLDDPDVTLAPGTTAGDVEGWDSMSNITFVVEVEQAFRVKFKTAEIEEMRNVGDMVELVAAKAGA